MGGCIIVVVGEWWCWWSSSGGECGGVNSGGVVVVLRVEKDKEVVMRGWLSWKGGGRRGVIGGGRHGDGDGDGNGNGCIGGDGGKGALVVEGVLVVEAELLRC